MKKSTVIKKLKTMFPGIDHIHDAVNWGGDDYKMAIHLGDAAEGGMIGDLPAADYYNEFNARVYDNEYGFGVHEKLAKALNKFGYHTEWYDAGTLMAWEN